MGTINSFREKFKVTTAELEELQSCYATLRIRFNDSENSSTTLSQELNALRGKLNYIEGDAAQSKADVESFVQSMTQCPIQWTS
jgi:predicted  nucleic acid-binding Zn-ribbon protein